MTNLGASAQRKLSPREEAERMCRLEAAVALVEHGDARGCKVSVRRAGALYGIPKSTVHSKIQSNRGIKQRRRRRPSRSCSSRSQQAALHKLRIGFLINQEFDSDIAGIPSPRTRHTDSPLLLPPLEPVESAIEHSSHSIFQDQCQLNLLLPILQ
eukprot:IDg14457t1